MPDTPDQSDVPEQDTLEQEQSAKEQHMQVDDISIDPEFQYLLPPLSKVCHAALEADILENGCRDALVLWEGHDVLVDGHNRFEILKKHNLPFRVTYMKFASREDVIIWIITTQIARRNLSSLQLTYFWGRHYRADRHIHGSNQYITAGERSCHNDNSSGRTADRLAKEHGISPTTILRAAQVSVGVDAIGEISSPAKRMILEEEVSITRNKLRELSTADADYVAEVARAIEEGTFEHGTANNVAPEKNLTDPDPFTTRVLAITSNFEDRLKNLTGDREERRSTIRSLINELEEMYQQA